MDKRLRKTARTSKEYWEGKHRFEHWYADNQVYFITARCTDKCPAFASEEAKTIFWGRFTHWTREAEFTPWVTSLMSTHYHVLGYNKTGENFGPMMRRIHGAVAKLVNDLLPHRRVPFWSERWHQDYFDGCIRDEKQCHRAFQYTLTQSVRHGICTDWRDYPHTRVSVDLERGVKRALELRAFLEGVPYKRYMVNRRRRGRDQSDAQPENQGP